MPRSIGLFGGSFNPAHIGHVLLARWARAALRLDEVWLLPCAQSADGKKLAPAAARLRVLRAALKGERGLKICGLDLERGGVSRAVDTLRALRAGAGPQARYTWLLGQDQALRLPRWKEARALPALAGFAYFSRRSAPAIPMAIHRRFRLKAVVVPSIEISSSLIRHENKGKKRVTLGVFDA
jgi:nicotinate-nucleotide adenylyltransferase